MLICIYLSIDSLGLIFICYVYLYTLLFTNLDVLSFLSTLSLYIQTMVTTIWLLIKINSYVIHAVSSILNDSRDFY